MKVLVDTCVWVDFFRGEESALGELLAAEGVVCHALVVGELATGNLPRRAETLKDLLFLEQAKSATLAEVLELIESRALWGRGLHFNDISLLASALLTEIPLWTNDKRLQEAAHECGCSFNS